MSIKSIYVKQEKEKKEEEYKQVRMGRDCLPKPELAPPWFLHFGTRHAQTR